MSIKELVYIILDLSKAATSDDSFYTEEHVIFLCKKYRAFLLKKEQDKNKGSINSDLNTEIQQVCCDLELVESIDGTPCTGGFYLRSINPIPKILDVCTPKIYPLDYYQGININLIPRERMRFVGNNKYLKNIIYASIGPDYHLYLNSLNPQFQYLKKLCISGIFEDFDAANELSDDCFSDMMDASFPLREYLIPMLIELVVKELVGASYRPEDSINNASDDLSDIKSWIRLNMKSALQKQIEK